MRKNNKVLFGLLIVVLLAVIGLSAYAYQKQKVLNNVKPKVTETKKDESKFEKTIKESSSNFNKENDLKALKQIPEADQWIYKVTAFFRDIFPENIIKSIEENNISLTLDLTKKHYLSAEKIFRKLIKIN